MKFNDDITLDLASVVKDVMEGKVKKEEVKYPHKMYHPENGEEVEVKDKAEHEKYAAKGWVHEKPKMESPEEPKSPDGKNGPQTGEKDFKDKHSVKKSGEKEDGTVVKEAKLSEEDIEEDKENGYMNIPLEELSDKQKEYQKVFKAAMKKFDVKSPADFKDDEKKKEFFNYIDKNYKADKESD
jgi:hypothetical protein